MPRHVSAAADLGERASATKKRVSAAVVGRTALDLKLGASVTASRQRCVHDVHVVG